MNRPINKGFSLIEILIALALLSLLAGALFTSVVFANKILLNSKAQLGALAIADKYMEAAHAISWKDLGVKGQSPDGVLPKVASERVANMDYQVENSVFWIDDPKDGSGAQDKDSNRNDYKLYKLTISWNVKGRVYSHTRVTKIYAPF